MKALSKSGEVRGSLLFTAAFKKMPTASLVQIPVQNVWYTILPATRNCRLMSMGFRHDNTGNVDKICEIRLTIDGVVITIAGSVAAAILFSLYVDFWQDVLVFSTTYNLANYYASIEGRNVMLEMRTTEVVGVAPTLSGYAMYEMM